MGEVSRYHNIYVVYTKEAETADAYIEKATYALSRKKHRVRVATSDNAEQMIILGHGALRVPAAAFHAEVEQAAGQIAALLARQTVPHPPGRSRQPWSGPGGRRMDDAFLCVGTKSAGAKRRPLRRGIP